MSTWEFTAQRAGSRRVEDGVWFEMSGNWSREPNTGHGPDWVWLVHWPDPRVPPVWLDPVKHDLGTAADVERYIDATWPAP